jgi:nucleotide-binding universal stress UspA family protein
MERIVVGVDGSEGSAAALAWAVKLADETGARVEAVYVWEPSYAWMDGSYWPAIERWSREIDQAQRAADESLDYARREADTGLAEHVPVARTVVWGEPAQTLCARAREADLLVVGSRGRGRFKGLVLGSVSQQCVREAAVPVVVVPALAKAVESVRHRDTRRSAST